MDERIRVETERAVRDWARGRGVAVRSDGAVGPVETVRLSYQALRSGARVGPALDAALARLPGASVVEVVDRVAPVDPVLDGYVVRLAVIGP